jgi:hypothetical protein
MKFMLVKGNVVGGHVIKDMGMTVPYQGEVRVPQDRAAWSQDFNYALSQGLITKVGVVDMDSARPVMPQGYTNKLVVGTPAPQMEAKPKRQILPVDPDKELKNLNKALLTKLSEMADQQKSLMLKIEDLLERDPSVMIPTFLPESLPASKAKTFRPSLPDQGYEEDEDPEDQIVFVPSKIRSEGTKISSDMKVEASLSKTDQLDSVAQALSALKPKRSRPNKNKVSNE